MSPDAAALGPFDAAFLASLSRLAFAVRRERAVEGEGRVRRDRRGGRIEFADHRPYATGDDPRLVDWSAFARTGRLFVKEFEREEDLAVLVVVDASASMALHGKLRAAQRLAYALCYLALSGGSRARVAAAADGGLRMSGTVAGTARIAELAAFLAALRGAGRTDLDASLRLVPEASRGSRVVLLISDLLAENDGRGVLAARTRRGDDVHVIHLAAGPDRAPELPHAAVLVDAETGERVPVDEGASRLLATDWARRERRFRAFAAAHRASYVPVDPAAPTEEIVVRWLRAGGVVT